jgi:hypothetical protein
MLVKEGNLAHMRSTRGERRAEEAGTDFFSYLISSCRGGLAGPPHLSFGSLDLIVRRPTSSFRCIIRSPLNKPLQPLSVLYHLHYLQHSTEYTISQTRRDYYILYAITRRPFSTRHLIRLLVFIIGLGRSQLLAYLER